LKSAVNISETIKGQITANVSEGGLVKLVDSLGKLLDLRAWQWNNATDDHNKDFTL
jgi:hypothetical protein